MPLQKTEQPYRSDMFDSLFVKKKEEPKIDTTKKETKKKNLKKLKEKSNAIYMMNGLRGIENALTN
jgi:hypothetical protein